jgi:hypothetical protein
MHHNEGWDQKTKRETAPFNIGGLTKPEGRRVDLEAAAVVAVPAIAFWDNG